MGRCGCASECLCTVTGSGCVTVSGSGSIVTPYTVTVDVDPDGTNALECRDDGLYVNALTGGIPVWATAERPSPGTVGYTYYDTDVPGLFSWSGAIVGYTPPWNLPWGQVAYAETMTKTTGLGAAYGDLTGLSVTWTAVTNRLYRVTGFVDLSSTLASVGRVAIADGVSAVMAQSQQALGANEVATQTPLEVFTGVSGSTTRKLRGLVTSGSGATQSDVYGPHFIMVEDIGPAGVPT